MGTYFRVSPLYSNLPPFFSRSPTTLTPPSVPSRPSDDSRLSSKKRCYRVVLRHRVQVCDYLSFSSTPPVRGTTLRQKGLPVREPPVSGLQSVVMSVGPKRPTRFSSCVEPFPMHNGKLWVCRCTRDPRDRRAPGTPASQTTT